MRTEESAALVTLVCLLCGREKFFVQAVPATLACEQCGGTVFRTFDTPTEPDDAATDALKEPASPVGPGGAPPLTPAAASDSAQT